MAVVINIFKRENRCSNMLYWTYEEQFPPWCHCTWLLRSNQEHIHWRSREQFIWFCSMEWAFEKENHCFFSGEEGFLLNFKISWTSEMWLTGIFLDLFVFFFSHRGNRCRWEERKGWKMKGNQIIVEGEKIEQIWIKFLSIDFYCSSGN